MKHLQDLPVLVLGLGASGLAMARWCARHGAQVTLADTREAPPQLGRLREELPQVRFVAGRFCAALVEGTPIRAVYRSPGLAPAVIAPVVDAARALGLPVAGELELFAQALRDLDAQRRAQQAPGQPDGDAAAVQAEAAGESQEAGEAADPAATAFLPPMSEADPAPRAPVAEDAAIDDASALSGDAIGQGGSLPHARPGAAHAGQPLASQAAPGPSTDTAPPAAERYVPRAAREAAEFVARLAELSVPATAPGDAAWPVAVAPAVPVRPPVTGYTPAVLAITGTNGKTTVTSLTGQLVAHAGRAVAVAGNIGPTLLDTLAAHIDAGSLPEVWVLELSSFQLDGVQGFEPTAATVLNITQDHLDWHGDMAAYAAAKARIFGQQGLLVLNRDDAAVMAMLSAAGPARSVGARKSSSVKARLHKPQVRAHLSFGTGLPQRPGDFGIERVNGMAWLVRAHEADETHKRRRGAARRAAPPQASASPLGGQRGHEVPSVGAPFEDEELHIQRLMPADALRIRGQHNALNALAALALATAAGCPVGSMLYGLREYRGEPHRVECVAVIDGVEYFDDSKGTNVGATVAALTGLGAEHGRVVVILGGDGKGQDFAPLAEPVRRHARAAVLIGRDGPAIGAALADAGVPLLAAASLEEAVAIAARSAHAGDAVLLSPACASFDMFKDYAHRAEVFRTAVDALQDAPGSLRDGLPAARAPLAAFSSSQGLQP